MQIAIAADHAGYELKQVLVKDLAAAGHHVQDLGTDDGSRPGDYADYAELACTAVRGGGAERAILVCGSGVGVTVAANKFPGIRAGLCHDHYSAHQGVEHDDMNVLCIGARIIGPEPAREIARVFLEARFSGEERHVRRLDKVRAIEQRFLREQYALMTTNGRALWTRFCDHRFVDRHIGFALDVSRVEFDDGYLEGMTPAIARAMDAMEALEGGAIANRDEERMVGHYWLRAPELAPQNEIRGAIETARASILAFADAVHTGRISGSGGRFEHVLHIGIGGSALGPQLLAQALGGPDDRLSVHFIDNTDPDGIDRVLAELRGELGRTLVTVVSKSGSTPEPRNGMLEVQAAYQRAGVAHAPHFVAVTTAGSRLDRIAESEGWLKRFPMWDWVGGRTSVTSTVGLVPAALQGIDVDGLLEGAAAMDRLTRGRELADNPAALMALMWHRIGDGRGARDMVVLPYKDRLLLFARYLQQLVMESLGKELDRSGATVHQGIAVYGNKGSTDQHAYVQQLRDGVHNFFVTFIQVLDDRDGPSIEVEPGITAGDYLLGFLQGTRQALAERGRESITITIERVTPSSLGALIALYERAVGLYAELIDVNAYHQPGVEAGKKAAADALELQRLAMAHLQSARTAETAEAIAEAVGRPDDVETIYTLLGHLAHNERGVTMTPGTTPHETTFEA